jgi:hypothetical protein
MKKTNVKPPGTFLFPWDVFKDGKMYDYISAATEEEAIENSKRRKRENVDKDKLTAEIAFSYAGNDNVRVCALPYKRVLEDGTSYVGIEAGWPNGETTYIEM